MTKRRVISLSEGLFLAFITAIAYLAAFTYQASYLDAFGIPLWVIETNVAMIFYSAFGLVFALGVIVVFAAVEVFRDKHSTSYWTGSTVMLLVMFGLAWHFGDASVAIAGIIVTGVIGVGFLAGKFLKSLRSELQDDSGESVPLVPRDISLLIAIALASVVLSAIFGKSNAYEQRNFLMVNAPNRQAVVGGFGDKIVTVDWDETEKVFLPTYRLLKQGDLTTPLTWAKLPSGAPVCGSRDGVGHLFVRHRLESDWKERCQRAAAKRTLTQ